jgi:hypothetical protein
MTKLKLRKINDTLYRVMDVFGDHVGSLRLINALWKFKAIGYDAQGDVIPGGGPLTDRHNTTFARIDLAEICAGLGLD